MPAASDSADPSAAESGPCPAVPGKAGIPYDPVRKGNPGSGGSDRECGRASSGTAAESADLAGIFRRSGVGLMGAVGVDDGALLLFSQHGWFHLS